MANNPILLDAALAGCAGGISTRWLTDPIASNYTAVRNIAVLFANTVDGLIPTDTSLTPQDANLLQEICFGVWSDRYPISQDSFTVLAQACVAFYSTVRTQNQQAAPYSLAGVGLIIDSTYKLRPNTRPRRFFEWDYFWTGNTTSGSIGKLGWNLLGSGTPAITRVNSTFVNSAKLLLSTSNVANNRSCLVTGETETRQCSTCVNSESLQWLWRMNNSLATKRVFFGWSSDFSADPLSVANSLGVVYDSGVSPNYQLISRVASVGAPFNTGLAVPQNIGQMFAVMQRATGTFDFYVLTVNDTAYTYMGTLTNVGFNGNFGWRLETLAASVANLELGYYGQTTVDLAGLYASDDLLFDFPPGSGANP